MILRQHFSFQALTNKANCFFADKDFEKAKQYYEEALKIDASCIEALYNLGKLPLTSLHLLNRSNEKQLC